MKLAIIIFLSTLYSQTFADIGSLQCSKSDSSSTVGVTSSAAFWKGFDGAQYITELTDDSHEEFVKNNPTGFVMYYTTWCGYSKQARKGFAGAAKKMNGKVSFGAVDCDKAKNACRIEEHPVQGYPTFYLYKDGEWKDEYQSERTTAAFVSYLNNQE